MLKTHLSLSLLVAMSFGSVASDLDKAQSVQAKTNASSAASQKRIDASAERTLQLNAEIEQLEEEVKNLEIYQKHLTSLVSSQEQEVESLNGQIDEIKRTRQGVVPLMYDMISGLKIIIEQDAPIKLEQRSKRVEKLKSMMVRADIADAEKYRRILEAYQIEMDYGTKLSSFQGELLSGGQTLNVNMLHLGRVSVVARSLNESQYWAWSQNEQQWLDLGEQYKPAIDHAFSIANQQIAPALVTLPLSLKTVKGDK